MSLTAWIDRYLSPVPRARWLTVRTLTALFVAIYCIARFGVLTRFTRMSAERFSPVGPVMLLDAPVSTATSTLIVVITIALGFVVALGHRTRITVPLLALGTLWVTSYRNSWGMLFHTENLLCLHLSVLAIGEWATPTDPTTGGLTPILAQLRAALHPGSDMPTMEDGVHEQSGWPLRLMGAITIATYVLAGVAKLRNSGLAWMDGEILRNTIAHDALRKAVLGSDYASLGAWMVQHDALFIPLAWATMVLELGAPLAYLHRFVRWAWIATAWSFHFGVQWIMWIGFPYPLSLIAYASLLPVEHLWRLPLLRRVVTTS